MSEERLNYTEEEDYKVILGYLKDFFRTRRFILFIVTLFLILGSLNILISPKVYKSKVTFITQSSGGIKTSGLGGIAKLLGGGSAGLNTNSSDIPAFLYPNIMESLPFQRRLYQTPIKIKSIDSVVSFKDYALHMERPSIKNTIAKYTIGLPSLIFGSKKSLASTKLPIDSLEFENSEERKIITSLKKKVSLSINEENGTLEIEALFNNEPIAAAQLAQSAQKILQDEIIRYRIGQAVEKFDFIEKQYVVSKKKYEDAQYNLASYNDRNLYNSTQSSLIRKTRLENESNLLFSIYSDLEQQRLAQGLKIQEDTPAFTTINPAVVPLQADNKNPFKTLLIFGSVGFFIAILKYVFSVGLVYVKTLWREV